MPTMYKKNKKGFSPMQLVFGRQSVVPGITDGHHGASGGVGLVQI